MPFVGPAARRGGLAAQRGLRALGGEEERRLPGARGQRAEGLPGGGAGGGAPQRRGLGLRARGAAEGP